MKKTIGLASITLALLFSGCGSDDDNDKISNSNSENKVAVVGENLKNNSDTFAPKIAYFQVTGNSTPQDGKAVVSLKKGGNFSYSVTLKDNIYTNRVYSALLDGSRSVILEYDFSMGTELDFDCKVDTMSDDGTGIDYTCGETSLDNTKGEKDTFMTLMVCNDTEDKCSTASVPILFTE